MIKTCIVLPDGRSVFSGVGTVDAIQSVTLTECVNSAQELTLGSVCANMVEVKLITPGGGLTVNAGDEITVFTVDEEGVRRQVGVFITEKPTRPSANTMSVTAYDRILRLDKDLTQWLERLTGWPYRVLDFAHMVAAECGLVLKNTSLLNGDYLIQKFSGSGITGRRLMEWIGQICAKFCRATPEGEIEFAWYTIRDSINIAPSGDGRTEIPYCMDSLTYEDYETVPIEKVQVRLTDADIGAVYPQLAEEVNTYIITGNYLLTTDDSEALQEVAKGIYEAICHVRYTPCKVSIFADSSLAAGDIVTITDANRKPITAYIMTRVRKGQKDTLTCTGSHRRDSSSVVNNETLKSLSGKVLEVHKSIEGLQVQVKSTKTEIEETLGDYYTKEETEARINVTADSVEISVSKNYATKSEVETAEKNSTNAVTTANAAKEAANTAIKEATVNLRIDSSRGTVFKNNAVSTVLSAVIYKGSKRITDITALHEEFGNGAYLEWLWQRMGEESFGTILSTDSRIGNDGFTFTLSPEDVDTKVVFMCQLITD